METCLVTGSTGFLGSYVVAALARSGRRVLALTRRPVATRLDHVIPIEATLEGLTPLQAAISKHGCQRVFHLAARIPTATASLTFEAASATNVLGTARLLDLLREVGPGLVVFASSIAVYAASEHPLTENSSIGATDAYGASKYCGEVLCDAFSTQTGIRSVALRIAAPYGAGMDARTVLPIFLRAALAGETPRFHGTGSRTQEFVHAEDIARACLLAIERGQGAFNIGGAAVSMRDLARVTLEVAQRDPSEAQASGAIDPQEGRIRSMSLERARRDLGYTPQVELKDGIRSLVKDLSSATPREIWWEALT